MNNTIQFKSSFSFSFYLACLLMTGVLGLSLFRFSEGNLDLTGLVFLNGVFFLTSYYFSLRFDCILSINNGFLKVKYVLPFRKPLIIEVNQIKDFEKYEDTVHRYYKRVVVRTVEKDYVIEYNISVESDEKLQNVLRQLVVKKK